MTVGGPSGEGGIAGGRGSDNYHVLCSAVHGLLGYYEELQREREKVASELPVWKQKELDVGVFSPLPAKRSKVEVEEREEGLYELHIKYDK